MKSYRVSFHGRRVRYGCVTVCCGAAIAAAVLTAPTHSQAGPTEPVVRVEEDWELVLDEPSDSLTAPQFHTVLSPVGDLESIFAQVTWNYREIPDFAPGGLQIQAWNGETLFREKSFGGNKLSTTAETITWTQSLETDGSILSFTVTNGQSTTWGTFGYPGQNMKVQGTANLPNLNTYNTDVTVNNSCVSFGSNRVISLVVTEVRRYGPSGLLSKDTTRRVVSELE